MLFISSVPVTPAICITPASPQRTDHLEHHSPILSAKLDLEQDDEYRAKWLSPPLASCRDEFKSLLEVSRDRRAKLGMQTISPDLRKKSPLKQLERTTRFLAKVGSLPLCTGTAAVSQPEVYYSSSASRGLVFESSGINVTNLSSGNVIPAYLFHYTGEDEQEGCDTPTIPLTSSELSPALLRKGRCVPPSLDEITARLKPVSLSSEQVDRRQSRLPNFLKASGASSGCTGDRSQAVPVRPLDLHDEKFGITFGQEVVQLTYPDTRTLTLGTKHAIIPHAAHIMTAPTLQANRANTTQKLFVTLRRRGNSFPSSGHHHYIQTSVKARKHSSLPKHGGCVGFHNTPISLHVL